MAEYVRGMEVADIDALLERHRDRFRSLLRVIVAEEQGEDPFLYPLDRFRSLSGDEKAALVQRAATIAHGRVKRELKTRGAAWLVLVGDDVAAAGAEPWAMPSPEEVLRLGEPRGLVAYLFEAPLIEELPPSISPWAPLGGGDHYPAVPLVLYPGEPRATPLIADLDTGSYVTLFDAELVEETAATWFTGEPLGDPFFWTIASVDLELGRSAGAMTDEARGRARRRPGLSGGGSPCASSEAGRTRRS
jgi:hypothetical protein